MHPLGFESTASAVERPQAYALDRATTRTNKVVIIIIIITIIIIIIIIAITVIITSLINLCLIWMSRTT
jgi:t-SNARE complex subunit (syntaxin)